MKLNWLEERIEENKRREKRKKKRIKCTWDNATIQATRSKR